jgi:hypothetical protein
VSLPPRAFPRALLCLSFQAFSPVSETLRSPACSLFNASSGYFALIFYDSRLFGVQIWTAFSDTLTHVVMCVRVSVLHATVRLLIRMTIRRFSRSRQVHPLTGSPRTAAPLPCGRRGKSLSQLTWWRWRCVCRAATLSPIRSSAHTSASVCCASSFCTERVRGRVACTRRLTFVRARGAQNRFADYITAINGVVGMCTSLKNWIVPPLENEPCTNAEQQNAVFLKAKAFHESMESAVRVHAVTWQGAGRGMLNFSPPSSSHMQLLAPFVLARLYDLAVQLATALVAADPTLSSQHSWSPPPSPPVLPSQLGPVT